MCIEVSNGLQMTPPFFLLGHKLVQFKESVSVVKSFTQQKFYTKLFKVSSGKKHNTDCIVESASTALFRERRGQT